MGDLLLILLSGEEQIPLNLPFSKGEVFHPA